MKAKRMTAGVFGRILVAWVATAAASAGAAETPQTDGEVWNEGVGFYEKGDVTNALRVLRPLMLSKTHGGRAAEVVAKLEHERGNREESAAAAQIALRARPDDPRANRNFTRATDGLAETREQKRVEAVLKAAQGRDPGSLLQAATRESRDLMSAAGGYRTNRAERAVALADALAARAKRLADVWIPVKEAVAQGVTNEQQATELIGQIAESEARAKAAAKRLGDLDAEAYGAVCATESDLVRFFKLMALPPAAIGEDLIAQSNAWLDVEAVNERSWQRDALDYTRAFRAKFPAWARAYESAAQADTNKPPFTAEDQAKVAALATELEKVQLECCEKNLPASQERAIDLINRIRELLPKDNSPSQSPQQNPQQQPQQNPQNQDQQQNQQNQQDQQDQQEKQQKDPDQQEQKDSPKDETSEEPPPKEDQEMDAVLRKAQERNDEHEADKKAKMRNAPLPPNERDW